MGICDGAPSTVRSSLSIIFINVLSNYRRIRCMRYLVFPALFSSINMVFIDYMCITSVTEFCKSIKLLLK